MADAHVGKGGPGMEGGQWESQSEQAVTPCDL